MCICRRMHRREVKSFVCAEIEHLLQSKARDFHDVFVFVFVGGCKREGESSVCCTRRRNVCRARQLRRLPKSGGKYDNENGGVGIFFFPPALEREFATSSRGGMLLLLSLVLGGYKSCNKRRCMRGVPATRGGIYIITGGYPHYISGGN
jgi:hypothetical protein